MSKDISVLLIDDDEKRLEKLAKKLTETQDPKFSVTPFKNPYRAFLWLKDNHESVEFAFVDHIFSGISRPRGHRDLPRIVDGTDMARAISARWSNIGIILYSGDVKITQDDEWEGLAAGAHRYVHVKPAERLVEEASQEFISEIRELRQLKEALEEFHLGRKKTDVLQRSIKVGIDLIDRRYKVWFRNQDYWDIVGDSPHPHQFCCARFHARPWPPCRGCLVCRCLQLSKPKWEEQKNKFQRIFFSPVYPGGKLTYKYMLVWTEPIYPKGNDSKPIAAVETVVDLTGSPTIEQIKINDHLAILAKAITELTCSWLQPKRVPLSEHGIWLNNDERPGYCRIRVYRAAIEKNKPVSYPLHNQGWLPTEFNTVKLTLKRTPTFQDLTNSESALSGDRAVWVPEPTDFVDFEKYSLPLGCTRIPLQFALFDGQKKWIGWIAIDEEKEKCNKKAPARTRELDRQDADLLLPYANEIARVLEKKLHLPQPAQDETSRIFEEVQSKIVLASNPQEALQTVIDGIVGFNGIKMGHIRVKKGNMLVMTAGKGHYYEHAERSIPLGTTSSVTIQVVQSGMPVITHNIDQKHIQSCIQRMASDCAEVMKTMNAHGVFPLKAFGEVLGSLSLQGQGDAVFNEETRQLCIKLAEIASYVLHDLTLQETAAERGNELVWRTAAASFAHRIGNSLPAAVTYLDLIQNSKDATPQIKKDAQDAMEAVKWAQEIATKFSKYGKPAEISAKQLPVKEVFISIAEHCRKHHKEVPLKLVLPDEVKEEIMADKAALQDVFLSLCSDSIIHNPDLGISAKIRCSVESEDPSQKKVRVFYTDNGKGVPLKDKNRIFEPFFGTRTDGTGIGLTDCKKVIEAHGGSIFEDGIPGEGVRFNIMFPLI